MPLVFEIITTLLAQFTSFSDMQSQVIVVLALFIARYQIILGVKGNPS